MTWKHFLPFVKESIPSQRASIAVFYAFFVQNEQTIEQTVKFMVLTSHSLCDIIIMALKKLPLIILISTRQQKSVKFISSPENYLPWPINFKSQIMTRKSAVCICQILLEKC